MRKVDSVTMQVIRYAMEQTADEMGRSLMRMSRTTIVKEIMDFACAVLDRQGQTIAQAHCQPMLLYSLEMTARKMVEMFPEDYFQEGDVIVSNDPYLGGQHIMDVQFFSPIICEGKLWGFVADIAHQLDMGGTVPGGVAGGLTEIYQEVLRLSILKLYHQGLEDRQLFTVIANNIRLPERTLGDFKAQAAATFVGVRRVKEILAKYGVETVTAAVEELMDYSERRMRQALSELPDGSFTGVDFVDDDGHSDEPVKIQVNLHKRGDSIEVDFDGTSKQVRGNINCPIACTRGALYYALIGVVDPYIPVNAGTYRPITIRSDPGLLTNPILPAAVTARSQVATKIVEAMLKALAPVAPDRVTAGSHGQAATCAFVGTDPETGKGFAYVEIQGGGSGARSDKDGPDGQDIHLGRFMNTPVEAAELEFPVMIERYELLPDSGGAGKFRGGVSLRKDIRFLADVTITRYTDRQEFSPQGLFGGKEGSRGRLILNEGTPEEQRLKSKGVTPLKKGARLSIRLPGSGGYGNPLERDVELLRDDLLNGKVSLRSAREDYLVVFNEDLSVDERETEILRKRHTGEDAK